ncbi:MAG: restriction endonuclease subunit S [Gammaproteobacteria bacterium]|nr:restriction endonuclease subunit S [Gammaproteobacteria bacterium]
MTTVESVPIGTVVSKAATWDPKSNGHGEFTYINIASVSQEKKAVTAPQQIDCSVAPSRARQLVQCGDVLVSTVRPNLNAVALLPNSLDGATASTGFCVLRPVPGRLDSTYLYHWVRTPQFVREMTRLATGQSYPAVSDTIIKDSTLPLPPLKEQRRIAAILDKADAIRRKRQQAIGLTETFLRSVFLDMFGDPFYNPKGWDSVALGNLLLVQPQNGLYKPSQEYGTGVRILRIDGFDAGSVHDLDSLKRVRASAKEIETYGLLPSDVVVNRVNSRSHLGKCALVPELVEPVVFESNMIRIRLDTSRVLPRFATEFLTSQYVKDQVLRACKDAVNQSSINQGDVQALRMLVPPIGLQEKFVAIARSTAKERMRQTVQLGRMGTLFESLSSCLFASGGATHFGSAA